MIYLSFLLGTDLDEDVPVRRGLEVALGAQGAGQADVIQLDRLPLRVLGQDLKEDENVV